MTRLLETYRAVHEQGFIPIFVNDGRDHRMLIEACLEAGFRAVEYTLRCDDAGRMLPYLRKEYPNLHLLVGSTLDDEGIVARARRRYPQLRTLEELDRMGVDGFVSMFGWSLASIRRYSGSRLVIPTAMSGTEAFRQVGAGAHFIKFFGHDLPLVRLCRSAPAFDFCPVFVTGGMTLKMIPAAVNAGAVLVATGFDQMLKQEPVKVGKKRVVEVLRLYLTAVRKARGRKWPEMDRCIGGRLKSWLDSLPHHHPF